MNIIAGKEEDKEYNGSVPEFYVSVEMVADISTASGWKCRIGVTNLLPDKEVASGIGVSKNVNQFAKMQFIAPEDLRVMYNGENMRLLKSMIVWLG